MSEKSKSTLDKINRAEVSAVNAVGITWVVLILLAFASALVYYFPAMTLHVLMGFAGAAVFIGALILINSILYNLYYKIFISRNLNPSREMNDSTDWDRPRPSK